MRPPLRGTAMLQSHSQQTNKKFLFFQGFFISMMTHQWGCGCVTHVCVCVCARWWLTNEGVAVWHMCVCVLDDGWWLTNEGVAMTHQWGCGYDSPMRVWLWLTNEGVAVGCIWCLIDRSHFGVSDSSHHEYYDGRSTRLPHGSNTSSSSRLSTSTSTPALTLLRGNPVPPLSHTE